MQVQQITKYYCVLFLTILLSWALQRNHYKDTRLLKEQYAIPQNNYISQYNFYDKYFKPDFLNNNNRENHLKKFKTLLPDGIMFEEHEVITEDGYILSLFRFLSKKNEGKILKRPVLYIGGHLDSAESLFFLGENSPGNYFLENGFDLWGANKRGSKYSQKTHVNPNIKYKEYWDFSFQEVGRYDVKAFYDYILKFTKSKKLNVLGQSMGGLEYIVAAADDEIGNWIQEHSNKVVLQAPNILMQYQTDIKMKFVGNYIVTFGQQLWDFLGEYSSPVIPFPEFLSVPLIKFWIYDERYIQHIFPGGNLRNDWDCLECLKVLLYHYDSGTSMRQFYHIFQHQRTSTDDRQLYKYDFGEKENWERYNQATPPAYDFSRIRNELIILGSTFDQISPLEGLIEFDKITGANIKLIVKENWSHLAFIIPKFPGELFKIYDETFN